MKNFLFHPLHEFSVAGRVDTFISKENLKKINCYPKFGHNWEFAIQGKKDAKRGGGGGSGLDCNFTIISFHRSLHRKK